MQISAATICDFAQVRDGLLSVVSASITRVWRDQYPHQMGVMLAIILEVTQTEAQVPREIRVRVEDADGKRLAEASAGFQIGPPLPPLDPGEVMSVPVAVDFRNVTLPAAGRYQVVIDPMTDGAEPVALSFRAGFLTERPSD